MKEYLNAEVIEHRGRISRIKFSGGTIGSIPAADEFPVGAHIYIIVEKKD